MRPLSGHFRPTRSKQNMENAYYVIVKNEKGLICFEEEDLGKVASFVGADRMDIRWQIKRTGRWDNEEQTKTVIETTPFEG